MEYTVLLSYDRKERVYNVTVPALPGCFTWGRTRGKALAHAREAIAGYLEVLKLSGETPPREVGLHKIRIG